MNKIKLLLLVTNYSKAKCESSNYKYSCSKLLKLYNGSIHNENHLQLTEDLNNELEQYNENQWRECIRKINLNSCLRVVLRSILKKQTETNSTHKNGYLIFNSTNLDLLNTNRFLLFKSSILPVNNKSSTRYYSSKPKQKDPDDLLTCKKKNKGGCQFHLRNKKVEKEDKCKTAVVQKDNKTKANLVYRCENKKSSCLEKSLQRATNEEDKKPKLPEKKESDKKPKEKSEAEKRLEKEILEKKKQYEKQNCETKSTEIKKEDKKVICPKTSTQTTKTQTTSATDKGVEEKKPDGDAKKEVTPKPQPKPQGKTICKRCFPQNRLHKLRPPPAWKIWLYSLFGIDLTPANKGVAKRLCCRIPKEDLEVKWVKLTEYPKPLLDPSKKHSSRTPEERLAIIRQEKKTSDTPKSTSTKVDKEFFAQSLPAVSDKAKWAANVSDNKKEEKKLKPDKPNLTGQELADKPSPPPPEKKKQCSSVDNIQKKTSDFCHTLIDLCSIKKKKKPTPPPPCTKKNNTPVNKVDVSKHICDKKEIPAKKVSKSCSEVKICAAKNKPAVKKPCNQLTAKNKPAVKKPCNQLTTNKEFEKRRKEGVKGVQMPERYSCGAGEIERSLISSRKGENSNEVHFKYRDHCKRKPGEEKPTRNN